MTSFPLVKPGASDFAGLVAILRRLAIAQSLPEIMQITTQAARTLLQADGITFVLREGDLCYYAAEDAISPLWMGRRFPLVLLCHFLFLTRRCCRRQHGHLGSATTSLTAS
jgi:hypothetical protein